MNVIIKGPLLSITGYGVHARQVFSWALSKGWNISCQVVPWGICTYYLDESQCDGLIGEVTKRTAPFPEGMTPDLSIQIILPDEWDPSLAKNNIGITAGVETNICSPNWVQACNAMNHVIVPSTFTKEMFVNSGVNEQHISVVPEAYTCGIKETDEKAGLVKSLDNLPTKFNFLMFGQLTGQDPDSDRKNTFYGLKWFAEAFKDDPDVGVVVKTNMGRLTAIDRHQTRGIFEALLREIKQGPYPKFYLAHGFMDENEIAGLYQSKNIKALLAPTRGEGWGLPILDAAVNGLPVIATNATGHMDFMKKVKFLTLDYDITDVPPQKIDGRIWIQGTKWAQVREQSFKKRIIKFRKSPDLPSEWAKSAAPQMSEEYSLSSVIKKYDEVWENLTSDS